MKINDSTIMIFGEIQLWTKNTCKLLWRVHNFRKTPNKSLKFLNKLYLIIQFASKSN